MHVVYNASTNRQTGDTADLNGNIGSGYTYDIENRLLKAGTGMPQYGYDAGNKRIARDTELTFWAGNQKWETYTTAVNGSSVTFTLTGVNVYFGGRLIAKGVTHSAVTSVAQDRLGSMNGKFYPFGQERPSATANDKEKFTGYFRDSATGLDYADQRYHNPGQGRFLTPDVLGGSLGNPGSLNKYAYVSGDPVNNVDPNGLQTCFFVDNEPQGCIPDPPTLFCGGDTSLRNMAAFPGASGGYFPAGMSFDLNSILLSLGVREWLPAKVYGGTRDQNAALVAGYQDALSRVLNKPDCNSFLDPTGDGLAEDFLKNTSYRIVDFGSAGGLGTGAQVVDSTNVQINSNPDQSPFFNQTIYNSSTGQFGYYDAGTGLLHELAHQTGVFGNDRGNAGLETQDIYDHCFN